MELFEDSQLLPEVLQAIKEIGFERPTEIQSQTIPFILSQKRDLIALAQTGTGKTAAFGLPILSVIDTDNVVPQALIICPTRELCLQIERDIKSFAKHMKIYSLAVYGGASILDQMAQLRKGVHIVVATPGRLVDIIDRGKINLSNITHLVLDESDEMLNMGFQEDIDAILEHTPTNKQTLLFSATMPKEVRRIANDYMINPEEITIGTKNSGADTVSHHAYIVRAKDRYTALKRLADFYPDIYGIVFCRTRQETKDIADSLMTDGYNADALHGDLSQAQRDYVMKKFRNRNLQILVATDVAARGLDVHDLTHVINYSIPDDIETYTHRSGRTGRAGKEGVSIVILNLKEKGRLKQIERLIKKSFELKQVPTGQEICSVKISDYVNKVLNSQVDNAIIEPYKHLLENSFTQYSKEELIEKFISHELHKIIEYYEHSGDINVEDDFSSRQRDPEDSRRSRKRNSDDRFGNNNFTRFFINVGKREDLDKSKMLRLLNEHANDRDIQYGAIDIMKSFSFFEVDAHYADKILKSFAKASYQGRPLLVEVAQAPTGTAARGSKNNFIKGDSYFEQRNSQKKNSRERSFEPSYRSGGRRNKHSDGGGRKRY